MLEKKGYRIWAVALLAIFASTTLRAGCFEKRAFDQVSVHLQSALENNRVLSPIEQLGLSDALRQLNPSRIIHLAEQNNLSIYGSFLADMLADLGKFQQSGNVQNSHLSNMDLNLAKQIFDRLCYAEQDAQNADASETLTHKLGLIYSESLGIRI